MREDQLGNVLAKAEVATAHTMTFRPPAILPVTVGPPAGAARLVSVGRKGEAEAGVARAKAVVVAASEDVVIDDDDASKKCKEAGGAQDSIDDNDDNDDDDDDDDDSSSSSSLDEDNDDDDSDDGGCKYQRMVTEKRARNKAHFDKLGFNDDLETKKTNMRKSAPQSLPSDGPRRWNSVRTSRTMTNYELHDEDEIRYQKEEDDEDEGLSKGGVPCAALSDDHFGEGACVLVDYKGKIYRATILRQREKSGVSKYLVHYDGKKNHSIG